MWIEFRRQKLQSSKFETVEAAASMIAETTLHYSDELVSVTVRASKPSALALAEAAEVEITRTPQDLPTPFQKGIPEKSSPLSSDVPHNSLLSRLLASLPEQSKRSKFKHTAALALGANLGDRFANIELALRLLEAPDDQGISRAVVVNTSFMYETAPMYVVDQPRFINCACIVGSRSTVQKHDLINGYIVDRDGSVAERVIGVCEEHRKYCRPSDFLQEWATRDRPGYPHIRLNHVRHERARREEYSEQFGRRAGCSSSAHSRARVRFEAPERVRRLLYNILG